MQEIKNISIYKQTLKDRILEKSMMLFAENGIRAVKMDDIANSLSISKRTLYEIYKDKEELLFEGIKKFYVFRHEQMKKIASDSDNVMDVIIYVYKEKVEEFRRTNPIFYSDIERYPKILEYFEEEKVCMRGQFLDFLHRGVSEGYFRNDINYDLIAYMFEVLGKYIMSHQLYHKYTMKDVFDNLIFVSLRGLCTPKGITILDRFSMDVVK